jgi:hypothetical protein
VPVPTLSSLGLRLSGLLLAGVGFLAVYRRQA